MANKDNQTGHRSVIAVGVIASAVIVVGGILIYRWIDPISPEEKNEFVRTAVAVVGSFVFLAGLYFTRETLKTAQDTVRINARNTEANAENVKLNAQNTAATIENQRQAQLGLTAERFYKASDQLGSGSAHVRLGALYALESIANDSERDYEQVMSVIAAYIRDRARRKEGENYRYTKRSSVEFPPLRCGEDVQAALTILGRRRKVSGSGARRTVDLSNTDISGASLHHANFRDAQFDHCIMHGVRIVDCDFSNATFRRADLSGALF